MTTDNERFKNDNETQKNVKTKQRHSKKSVGLFRKFDLPSIIY